MVDFAFMRSKYLSRPAKTAVAVGLVVASLGSGPATGQDSRIKDIAQVRGVRTNQLVGFGLVIGLSNSGDSRKSLVTTRATANMFTKLGMTTKVEEAVTQGIAGVVVTADLPAFSRSGDRIDVRLSTIGDAKSLAGGTLLMTTLRAGDGQVYAVAQGATIVGQASGSGAQVLTVATVPSGGVVEREFAPELGAKGRLMLSLRNPDFTTNTRIVDTVNSHFREFVARSVDPATIEVTVPEQFVDRVVEFYSELESLRVRVDRKAVVVLNERTGTVVMGNEVTIGPVTIAHGSLSIQVGGGKSGGEKANPQGVVSIGGSTVGKLVETMNSLGVRPADLVGILQAVQAAGALQGELRLL